MMAASEMEQGHESEKISAFILDHSRGNLLRSYYCDAPKLTTALQCTRSAIAPQCMIARGIQQRNSGTVETTECCLVLLFTSTAVLNAFCVHEFLHILSECEQTVFLCI